MAARLRMYHPDHRVRWWERVLDVFGGVEPAPRPTGIDYTLVNRGALRVVREFLDGTVAVCLLGDEMIRADSTWALPDEPEARRAAAEALVSRVRFGQVDADGQRLQLAIRWFEFADTERGTRVLIRLMEAPAPGMRCFLAANLGEDTRGAWTEYAVGAD